jgi:hypothetical protein
VDEDDSERGRLDLLEGRGGRWRSSPRRHRAPHREEPTTRRRDYACDHDDPPWPARRRIEATQARSTAGKRAAERLPRGLVVALSCRKPASDLGFSGLAGACRERGATLLAPGIEEIDGTPVPRSAPPFSGVRIPRSPPRARTAALTNSRRPERVFVADRGDSRASTPSYPTPATASGPDPAADARAEDVDGGELAGGQVEVEYIEVLRDPGRRHRLRDDVAGPAAGASAASPAPEHQRQRDQTGEEWRRTPWSGAAPPRRQNPVVTRRSRRRERTAAAQAPAVATAAGAGSTETLAG